jgi:hypothetical protein
MGYAGKYVSDHIFHPRDLQVTEDFATSVIARMR